MGLLDKAKDILNSSDAEEKSDQILDKAEDFAKSKLGDDQAAKVSQVRDAIDKKIGDQG
ncbi:antitoxin [Changpingibacter yushuensis]|uniref:antitoxin n=1 Tax=Changpingibacter yushuensis TaxID=2758440 RepID=UPI0015F56AE5|nr:antitoxin [Changpingibacter yushuensis]